MYSHRLKYLLVSLGVLVTLVALAFAMAPPHKTVIGVLAHAQSTTASLNGFRTGMAELGYVEPDRIEYLFAGPLPDPTALAEEAHRLVARKVDLLVALATPAAAAARAASQGTGIPVLFTSSADPQGAGLVDSLAHPGRNITGISFGQQEPARLEWLARVAPKAKRIWVPYNPNDPAPRLVMPKLEREARRLGITLVPEEVLDERELQEALETLPEDIQGIFAPTDSMISSQAPRVVAMAKERRLPLSSPHRQGVEAGALISFGINLVDAGSQAALLADTILHGSDASTLPVQPAASRLSINLATARSIGIDIPADIRLQADLVGE